LVGLDEVVWNEPPDREEAGSPNVVGAVALHAAIDAIGEVGWPALLAHDRRTSLMLHEGLRKTPGVTVLGPVPGTDSLPVAAFLIEGVPHALVAARLSAEFAIAVRHGCFCAHPYLTRLLGLSAQEIERFRDGVRHGDRRSMPGAVRASCGINSTEADIDALLVAVADIARGTPAPVDYVQDPRSGDFFPDPATGWCVDVRVQRGPCSPG